MLGDTYLTVHRWFKGFDLWTTKVTTTLVWVELPDLPIEFYNPEAVMQIASRIGKPVRVDRATEAGAQGKYARVCVEVDLSKRLLPKYKVEGVPYLIVYEGFHKICTKCGMYGTPTHLCKCDNPQEEDMMINDTEQVQKMNDPSNGKVFGEWMMPKRKAWRRVKELPTSASKPHNSQHVTQGNCFDVLNNEEDPAPNPPHVLSQGGLQQPATVINNNPLNDVEKEGNMVSKEGMATAAIANQDKAQPRTLDGHIGVNDGSIPKDMQYHKQIGRPVNSLIAAKRDLTRVLPTTTNQKKLENKGGKFQNQNQNQNRKRNNTADGAGNPSPSGIR
ncbi:hypothetical protein LINGRAHAP2_LOCUS27330 [Linum grandiflorum]